MNLNKLDVLIIKEFIKPTATPLTTSALAKNIFNPKNRYELQYYDSKIRQHLKKLCNYKIMKDEKLEVNNTVLQNTIFTKKVYFLDDKKIVKGLNTNDYFLELRRDGLTVYIKLG